MVAKVVRIPIGMCSEAVRGNTRISILKSLTGMSTLSSLHPISMSSSSDYSSDEGSGAVKQRDPVEQRRARKRKSISRKRKAAKQRAYEAMADLNSKKVRALGCTLRRVCLL